MSRVHAHNLSQFTTCRFQFKNLCAGSMQIPELSADHLYEWVPPFDDFPPVGSVSAVENIGILPQVIVLHEVLNVDPCPFIARHT